MKRLLTITGLVMSAVMLASCAASAEALSEQSIAEETAAAVTESETEDTEGSTEASDTAVITESGADTLVVVFSCTGTTKGVADRIADVTDADLYEIVPAVPYTDDDRDWNDENSRCTVEQNDAGVRPEIGSDPIDLEDYEVIFIGYPIWFGEEPRIMDEDDLITFKLYRIASYLRSYAGIILLYRAPAVVIVPVAVFFSVRDGRNDLVEVSICHICYPVRYSLGSTRTGENNYQYICAAFGDISRI